MVKELNSPPMQGGLISPALSLVELLGSMRILNDSCVTKIHAKGATQQAKLLTNVVRALACFV